MGFSGQNVCETEAIENKLAEKINKLHLYGINEIYESNKKMKNNLVYVFDIYDDENYVYDVGFIISLKSNPQGTFNLIFFLQ